MHDCCIRVTALLECFEWTFNKLHNMTSDIITMLSMPSSWGSTGNFVVKKPFTILNVHMHALFSYSFSHCSWPLLLGMVSRITSDFPHHVIIRHNKIWYLWILQWLLNGVCLCVNRESTERVLELLEMECTDDLMGARLLQYVN